MILKVPSTPKPGGIAVGRCCVPRCPRAVVPQIQAHPNVCIPSAAAGLETSISTNWWQWLIGSQLCELVGNLMGTGVGHFSPLLLVW